MHFAEVSQNFPGRFFQQGIEVWSYHLHFTLKIQTESSLVRSLREIILDDRYSYYVGFRIRLFVQESLSREK